MTTLKVFFKWLRDIGAIAQDPAVAILQRSGQAPLAQVLDPDETEAVSAFAYSLRYSEKPDVRPAFLFALILLTGIKKSEAMRIKPDDFEQIETQTLLLVRKGSVRDQYKERRITLDTPLVALLAEYRLQYMPQNTLFTCSARNLEYILEDLGTGAGIAPKISFEMLRWTCGLRDYLAGDDSEQIREKMGLSKISWAETFSKIKRLAGEEKA